MLPREDISRLAKLRMEGDQPGSVPKEEYIWPMKKIYLQEEYRVHTQKVQELMSTDPEKPGKSSSSVYKSVKKSWH